MDNEEENKTDECGKIASKTRVIGKPFPPNNCANPHGRPRKEDTFSDCLREYLAQAGDQVDENGKPLTRMQVAVRAMYHHSVDEADTSMFKEMLERGFGKVKDVVDMNTVQEIQLIDPVEKDI